MSAIAVSILAFVVTLGALISFHELGHFWVARRLGVKVLRYSIGFGRPLWRRRGRVDGTEYVIAAIPFGGYVRMLDEREGEVAPEELHRAFNRQPLWVRTAIVAAGPGFNFVFAIIAFWVMFMIGVQGIDPVFERPAPGTVAAEAGLQAGDRVVAVGGRRTETLKGVAIALLDRVMEGETVELEVVDADGRRLRRELDVSGAGDLAEGRGLLAGLGLVLQQPPTPPVMRDLVPGGAAERAGLRPGDRVVAVDGVPVRTWSDWAAAVRASPGASLALEIEREGMALELEALPDPVETAGGVIGRIGAFGPARPAVTVRYGPLGAIGQAVERTAYVSVYTLRMLWRMLTGTASIKNIGGPISIAQYAGQTASRGASDFLWFLGIVSISLGVLNLLPVPVLDGGHLLYYAIELVRGSPLSDEAQGIGQRIGLVLLFLLMGLAVANDIARLVE